jgi:hypothetical protein
MTICRVTGFVASSRYSKCGATWNFALYTRIDFVRNDSIEVAASAVAETRLTRFRSFSHARVRGGAARS